MASKSLEMAKLTRLKGRQKILSFAVNFSFLVMCLSIGFVVYAAGFPQHRQLAALEDKLQLAQQHERDVLADLEYHQIEFRALKTDPAFLEIHARDRLNYYREGERVLKFNKEP
jgi:hypothetical protein